MSKCSVTDCKNEAEYEVFFYDVYLHVGQVDVLNEQHESCPYLCQQHLNENERGAQTDLGDERLRRYRGGVQYPHAKSAGLGFCIYKPLEKE